MLLKIRNQSLKYRLWFSQRSIFLPDGNLQQKIADSDEWILTWILNSDYKCRQGSWSLEKCLSINQFRVAIYSSRYYLKNPISLYLIFLTNTLYRKELKLNSISNDLIWTMVEMVKILKPDNWQILRITTWQAINKFLL